MTQLAPEVIADILAEYSRTRSPFKAATACGIDVNIVWEVIDQNKDVLSGFQERFGGEGRPALAPYLVAKRHTTSREWDNTLPEIAQARAYYEAGTHLMFTGRDGQWLLLYSVPRKGSRDPKPNYFTPEQS